MKRIVFWGLFCSLSTLAYGQNVDSLQPVVPTVTGAASPEAEESGEDDWGDDAEDGEEDFDFEDETSAAPPPVVAQARPWSLVSIFQTREGFWLERLGTDPLATLRNSFDLKYDYRKKLWRVRSRVHLEYDSAYSVGPRHDAATRELYEYQVVFGDNFVARSFGDFELTVGRQTVVWGEANMLTTVDVINPRDQREPGIGELETLRLAVLGTRLGYFKKQHRVEAMVVHELNLGLMPAPFSEFSPLKALLASDPAAAALLNDKVLRLGEVDEPLHPRNWGGFLRWVYKGSGIDLGVYGAWLPDRQGVLNLDAATIIGFQSASEIRLPMEHPRYFMVGHSGAIPRGSWTFRWEVLGELDKSYNTGSFDQAQLLSSISCRPVNGMPSPCTPEEAAFPLGVQKTHFITGMLGAAWQGPDDVTVMVEGSRGVFTERPEGLVFPVDATLWAFRFGKMAMRQKLKFDLVGTAVGVVAQYGWLARAEVGYDIRDGLKASIAAVHYGSGHDLLGEPFKAEDGSEIGPFSALKEHDLLLFKLRWDHEYGKAKQ